MKTSLIVAAVGVCIWVGFQIPDGVRAGTNMIKAATMSIDVKISAANLLGDCGYDLDEFKKRREPSAACVPFIRKRLHLANMGGKFVGWANEDGYGMLCLEELLELPDDELVRTYAGWASRERDMLFMQPADLLMITALHVKYRCPRQQRAQG